MHNGLLKLAAQDLNLARKTGRISIVDTKIGCIDVEYVGGFYRLTARADMITQDLGTMKRKEAAEMIALLYNVEEVAV